MPDMTVHRHGDRWAVVERGATSPVKEFPSREAAELVARQMAAGGAVEVLEEDPTGLAGAQDPDAGEPVRGEPARDDGFDAAERGRTVQPGL